MRGHLVAALATRLIACRGERGPAGPPRAPATAPTAAEVAHALASDPEFARAVARELEVRNEGQSRGVVPATDAGAGAVIATATVTLDAQGAMTLDGHGVTQSELASEMRARVSANPDVRVVVAADRRASHQAVVAVIDSLRAVGVRHVAIAVAAP
jgi:hypothetical protein